MILTAPQHHPLFTRRISDEEYGLITQLRSNSSRFNITRDGSAQIVLHFLATMEAPSFPLAHRLQAAAEGWRKYNESIGAHEVKYPNPLNQTPNPTPGAGVEVSGGAKPRPSTAQKRKKERHPAKASKMRKSRPARFRNGRPVG